MSHFACLPVAGYSSKRFIFERAKELGVRSVVIDGPDSWSRVGMAGGRWLGAEDWGLLSCWPNRARGNRSWGLSLCCQPNRAQDASFICQASFGPLSCCHSVVTAWMSGRAALACVLFFFTPAPVSPPIARSTWSPRALWRSLWVWTWAMQTPCSTAAWTRATKSRRRAQGWLAACRAASVCAVARWVWGLLLHLVAVHVPAASCMPVCLSLIAICMKTFIPPEMGGITSFCQLSRLQRGWFLLCNAHEMGDLDGVKLL